MLSDSIKIIVLRFAPSVFLEKDKFTRFQFFSSRICHLNVSGWFYTLKEICILEYSGKEDKTSFMNGKIVLDSLILGIPKKIWIKEN